MKRFLRLLRYIFPYWYNAVLNLIFNLLAVVFSIFSVVMAIQFLGILFDSQQLVYDNVPFELSYDSVKHNFNYFISQIIINKGHSMALMMISLIAVSATFFKTISHYFAKFFMAPLRNNVVRDVRHKLYMKVLDLPIGYFTNERKGDIISRMTGDVQEIEVSIVRSLNVLFKEPISIIFYFGSLLFMNLQLTLFSLLLFPIVGGLIGWISKSLRKKSQEGQRMMGVILTTIEETLSGLRIIKAFNSQDRIGQRFYDENNHYTKTMTQMWRRNDLAGPLSEFLGTAVIVTIMWYGGSQILDNQSDLDPQSFIGYLMLFFLIIQPAKAFSSAFYNIQKGMASVERIDVVLDAENKIQDAPNAKAITTFTNEIVYKNIDFRYVDEFVLKNVSLTIPKGKTIALVGQSGSGKSTLVDLLPRFYDVIKGEILVDGNNIKDLKMIDLRNLMGIVNQDPILFNDTIFNNIAFGVESASEEQVIEAAKVANAHQFIMETPDGYNTGIGDRGSKLSGGQRQRISIARAVLKNPPVLILDEATSALDTESERLVQDALTNLMQNRTSIVIAHRLSTIVHADLICVLNEGKIVERGTHQELIEQNGIYKKLHDIQMFA